MSLSSDAVDAFPFEQLAPPAPSVERAGATLDDETIANLRVALQAESAQAAEALRAEAREQGRREGLEAARLELEPATQALAAALTEVAEERLRSADALERQAVGLALQIAEKVLCGTLAVQPERVVEVVRGSLRRVVERERLTLLVNPDDVDLVRSATDSLTGALGGIERLEIQGERRVPRGGCVLRTADGEIDARIEEQLDRAREVMEAELRA